jgi:hypothetical protein
MQTPTVGHLVPQPVALTRRQRNDLRAKIEALKPGHCRVFVRNELRPETESGRKAPLYVALVETLKPAQGAAPRVPGASRR